MSEQLLLTALVYLARLTDRDCPETEADELVCEIATLERFMRPADAAYFQAVVDVIDCARTL